jgi:hypothetical protein
MKKKQKKNRKRFSLSTIKPVGPRQVPVRELESPIMGLAFALVFPEANQGHMVSPLYFAQADLEAAANFIALKDDMPVAFRPLVPLAQAVLKGWLSQVANKSPF